MRARRPWIAAAAIVAASLTFVVPAAAEASYGAIAINPNTGAVGLSWEYPTQDGAKQRAERQCRGNCRIALWVRNRCGAVVEGRTRYVAAIAGTKKKALRRARKRAHNPDARRVAWVCSG